MDNFTPITLTESVNNIIAPKTFILQTLFKRTRQHLTTLIMLDVLVGGKKLAPFVKRGMPGKVLDKTGIKSQTFEPPHIRVKKHFGPTEVKYIRGEGQPVVTTGQSVSAGEKYVAQEQQLMKDEITRRYEWLAIQALQGGFSYADDAEGIDFEIDFLMPGANKPTLTSTAKWDDNANSDPVGNIRAWQRLIGQSSGKAATFGVANGGVYDELLKNATVQKLLDNRKMQLGILDVSKIAEEFGIDYRGNLLGVDLWEYNEQYVDASGNTQSMIADGKFILAAPNADYRMHYALTEDLEAGMVALPFFSKMWDEKDPSGLWLLTESNGLPVNHQPGAVVAAQVF